MTVDFEMGDSAAALVAGVRLAAVFLVALADGFLNAVSPNDDVVPGGADLTSRVSFAAVAAVAAQTYRIVVDGFLASGFALARNGSATLTWTIG